MKSEKPDTFLVGAESYREMHRPKAPAEGPTLPVYVRSLPWRGWGTYWSAALVEKADNAVAGKTPRARAALLSAALLFARTEFLAIFGVETTTTSIEQNFIERQCKRVTSEADADIRTILLDGVRYLLILSSARMGATHIAWRASADCDHLCVVSDGFSFPVSSFITSGIMKSLRPGRSTNCRCSVRPRIAYWAHEYPDVFVRGGPVKTAPGVNTLFTEDIFVDAPLEWRDALFAALKAGMRTPLARTRPTSIQFVEEVYDTASLQAQHTGPNLYGILPFWYDGNAKTVYVSYYAMEGVTAEHLLLEILAHVFFCEHPEALLAGHTVTKEITVAVDDVLRAAPHIVTEQDGSYVASGELIAEIGEAGYLEEGIACGISEATLRFLLAGGKAQVGKPATQEVPDTRGPAVLRLIQTYDMSLVGQGEVEFPV